MSDASGSEDDDPYGVIRRFEGLLYIVRDSELQRRALHDLEDRLRLIEMRKREAVSAQNEDLANFCLAQECVVAWLRAELNMWLHIKTGSMEEAWDNLIDAQREVVQAIRAHRAFAGLTTIGSRLHAIERIIFPPQAFLSAGLVVGRQECSICKADYEDCDHLVGMPYWGEFCFRKLVDVVADHVAIVKEPANKRCRVTHLSTDDGKRNTMTWRVQSGGAAAPAGATASSVTGVVLDEGDLRS